MSTMVGGHQMKRHQMLGIIKVFIDQGHMHTKYYLDLLGRQNFPALARYNISPVVSGRDGDQYYDMLCFC